MKILLRLGFALVLLAHAGCSSPVLPASANAGASLSENQPPPAEEADASSTAADSAVSRGGGNLMGGN